MLFTTVITLQQSDTSKTSPEGRKSKGRGKQRPTNGKKPDSEHSTEPLNTSEVSCLLLLNIAIFYKVNLFENGNIVARKWSTFMYKRRPEVERVSS